MGILLSFAGLALSAPFPQLPQAVPYGALAGYPFAPALPYGALAFSQAGVSAPVTTYAAFHAGLVYSEAQTYVHDPAGDVSDDSSPEAVAYVHDASGDK